MGFNSAFKGLITPLMATALERSNFQIEGSDFQIVVSNFQIAVSNSFGTFIDIRDLGSCDRAS